MDNITADLQETVRSLLRDQGSISASIYDTARTLSFWPDIAPSAPILDWLTSEQRADGGWGLTAWPLGRDVPTLAAVLALRHGTSAKVQDAVKGGVEYLRQAAGQWADIQDPPNGAELFLPMMLEEATAAELISDIEPYARLSKMGAYRRQLIPKKFHPAVILAAWEGWGTEPDPKLVDGSGGVGHSPATTAAWLRMARNRTELVLQRERARQYLQQAHNATNTDIPGLMPAAFPSYHFEQAFSMWALLVTGLLNDVRLQEVVKPVIQNLVMRPTGLGASDYLQTDGDNTGAALAVLHAAGKSVDMSTLRLYEKDDHFCAWRHEMQSALSVTARAVYALALRGEQASQSLETILSQQQADGRWPGDKWHASWLYTTMHCILAAVQCGERDAAQKGVQALLEQQHSDGGWGIGDSTAIETAYGLIALQQVTGVEHNARQRTLSFLRTQYTPTTQFTDKLWLAKDEYSPRHMDRVFILAAMLAEGKHD